MPGVRARKSGWMEQLDWPVGDGQSTPPGHANRRISHPGRPAAPVVSRLLLESAPKMRAALLLCLSLLTVASARAEVLLADDLITTPAEMRPGAELTIGRLMDLIEASDGYEDYLRRLTTRYRPDSIGSFFALHADRTVKPTSPQVFLTIGNATIAYAPQMYTEVFYSHGEETIHLQLVEKVEPAGKRRLTINAFTFKAGAQVTPAPEHELTPGEVRGMHTAELIRKTNRYAEVGCKGCHVNARRRMVEPDNHGRRFAADPSWRFRDEKDRTVVLAKLDGLFQQFAKGPTRQNKIYRWLWEQPRVVERGGEILPEDTFDYDAFVTNMIEVNGREMLGELKREPAWSAHRELFAAAVMGLPTNELFAEHGVSAHTLEAQRRFVELDHARLNLTHIRARNSESLAWILAEGAHDVVPSYANNDMLLLNRHAMTTIGPALLQLLATDEEWAQLGAGDRLVRLRLSDLDAKSVDEVRQIVLAPEVVAKTRRRTDTYLALMQMLNNRARALSYLSANVLKLSAETGREGADLLDAYGDALRHPGRSPINRYQAAVLTRLPGSSRVRFVRSPSARFFAVARERLTGTLRRQLARIGRPATKALP